MEEILFKKAKFIGTRNNLKKEIKAINGFPFATYIDDDNLPVLFANDEKLKKDVFKECIELGIEVVNA